MSPLLPVELARELEAFVYDEARLLDERRFDAWVELFADDGVYWVPGQPGQAAPADGLSLYHEAKALLALRARRLARENMHVQSPPVRTHHHVAAVRSMVAVDAADTYEVHASLIVAEWREDTGRWFAGRSLHRLHRGAEGLRIVLKRVNLIDCDAPHRALAVPF
jgi:benzoate/toluate 1,2-dioxygenase beta subunit